MTTVPEIPTNLVRVRQRNYRYTLEEKKNILLDQAINKLSNRAVARKYDLAEGSIRQYKKSIDIPLDYSNTKFTLHSGQPSIGSHLKPSLCQWIYKLRTDSCDVTVELAVFKLLQLDPTFKDGDFTVIRRWVYGFLKRNVYSPRNKTHIAQKPLNEAECHDFSVSVNVFILVLIICKINR